MLIQNGTIKNADDYYRRFPTLFMLHQKKIDRVLRMQNKLDFESAEVHVRINFGAGVGKSYGAYVTNFLFF